MKTKYLKSNLEPLVAKSKTFKEVIQLVGNSNYSTIKRYISKYNLDTSHFKPPHSNFEKMIQGQFKRRIPCEKLFSVNSPYSRNAVKKRIYKDNLKPIVCSFCGLGEVWRGRKISLVLDHINGSRNDHRLENLRLLCPNCNATLDTHCGKNTKGKYCSCGEEKSKASKCCPDCRNAFLRSSKNPLRRVKARPSRDELVKMVKDLGYVGTGKVFGVSDNAVRKWLRQPS